jgi:hypothetical protein
MLGKKRNAIAPLLSSKIFLFQSVLCAFVFQKKYNYISRCGYPISQDWLIKMLGEKRRDRVLGAGLARFSVRIE